MKNGQSTHSMTTKKLRRKLSGYGLRGQSLTQKIRNIIAGPLMDASQCGKPAYAFGWTRDLMDRHMRRALIGKGGDVKPQGDTADHVMEPQTVTSPVRRRSVISINRRYLG